MMKTGLAGAGPAGLDKKRRLNTMKTGDTKYYRVKQIIRNGRVVGYLVLVGRVYGYIVQLHYYDTPGYKVNNAFDSIDKAERFFDDVFKKEV